MIGQSVARYNWGEPERSLLVRSTGEISVCMYVCMYICTVRSVVFRCVYLLQFLVHFNTRARAVKPTSCMRWSRGTVITLWRAFLPSPTMNFIDGKRGFSGEENVSGSKEPAEENTPEIS